MLEEARISWSPSSCQIAAAGETTYTVWDRLIANLTAPFKLMRAEMPITEKAGRGSILNVSGEAGLRGNSSGNAYTASEHGIIGVTMSATFMYGPKASA